jgi:hypothetical protein
MDYLQRNKERSTHSDRPHQAHTYSQPSSCIFALPLLPSLITVSHIQTSELRESTIIVEQCHTVTSPLIRIVGPESAKPSVSVDILSPI